MTPTISPWNVCKQKQDGVDKFWISGALPDEAESNQSLIEVAPKCLALLKAFVWSVEHLNTAPLAATVGQETIYKQAKLVIAKVKSK